MVFPQISLEKDEHCTVIDNSDAERWIVSKNNLYYSVIIVISLYLSLKFIIETLVGLSVDMPKSRPSILI